MSLASTENVVGGGKKDLFGGGVGRFDDLRDESAMGDSNIMGIA